MSFSAYTFLNRLKGLRPTTAGMAALQQFLNTQLQAIATSLASVPVISAFAETLLDDTTAADARTTLGLGSMATQNSGSVTITGGSITGITDLAVADGGTGASTQAGARTNLGLGDASTHTVQTSFVDATAGRVLKVGAFGLGQDVDTELTNTNTHTTSGIYFGYGGAHASATLGTNPFPSNTGAFGLMHGTSSIGAASDYMWQMAYAFAANEKVAWRGRAASGWGAWLYLQPWSANLDTYVATPLDTAELGQLQNIGTTTISAAQWGYVGGADQAVKTTDTPTFAGLTVNGSITVTGSVDGRDVATDGTKLDGIEALADVTDTTNVTAAGALMDSELTSIAAVKALDQGVATTDSPTFEDVTFNGAAGGDDAAIVTLNGNPTGGVALTIADDAVGTITPPRNGGFAFITAGGTGNGPVPAYSAVVWFDVGTSLAISEIITATVGGSVDTSTSNVTGTTGTDGNVTVAAQSGVLKIENRSGVQRAWQVTFI